MSVLDLARPEIRVLTPYSSARMESQRAALMLDANESPWPPVDDTQELNRYPDPQPLALLTRLAQLYGVRTEQMLVCRGSDEAIDLLVRAFCRPGIDAVAISPPTFGMYGTCAGVQGAAIVSLPLGADSSFDAGPLLAGLPGAVKLVFVCSPNNPTGDLVPLGVIERMAQTLAGRALVVVDEAYIEFAGVDSAALLLERYRNLAVLRTLSKAWALAGVRIGSLLADPEVIGLLRRIMPPYPLPTPSVRTALAALSPEGERLIRERIAVIVAERERLKEALSGLPCVRMVFPSHTNFLTVSLKDAASVYRALARSGIVVRDVGGNPGMVGCLRISIGTPEENGRLIDALCRLTKIA